MNAYFLSTILILWSVTSGILPKSKEGSRIFFYDDGELAIEIDLSQIGHLASKGRVQDREYNKSMVVDNLIKMENESIPFLIDKLTDETLIKGATIDFWSKVTIGDIALIILTDFFTDSTWVKTTIPGISWDEMLKRKNSKLTAEQVLRSYVAIFGRKAIQNKWERVWHENHEKLYWDNEERCFKLKNRA